MDVMTRRSSMLFQHQYDVTSSIISPENIKKQLMQFCAQTKNDVRPKTARLFSELVYILRETDFQTLKDVYKVIKDKNICKDNNLKVK